MTKISETMEKSNIVSTTLTNRVVAHTSNEGATATGRSERHSLKVTLDWLGLTFPDGTSPEFVFKMLGLPFEDAELVNNSVINFYRKHYVFGHIKVLFDGMQETQGVHVMFSGQGLRQYEEWYESQYEGDSVDWREMLRTWIACDARVTRIDPAADDRQEEESALLFNLLDVKAAVEADCFVGRLKVPQIRYSKPKKGKRAGYTVYLGSRTSEAMLRVYDKGVEQGTYEAWNRVELELKHSKARSFVEMWLQGADFSELFFGALKDSVRFVVSSGDSNKSRWKSVPWWTEFLGDVRAVSLSTDVRVAGTLEEKQLWHERSVSKSLALLSLYFGREGYEEYLQRLTRVGRNKLRDSDLKVLRRQLVIDQGREDTKQKWLVVAERARDLVQSHA